MKLEELDKSLRGKIVRKQVLSSFIIDEALYQAFHEMPRHTHELAHLIFVIKGSYLESYGSKNRTVSSSCFTLHPVGDEHSFKFHENGGCLLVVQPKPQWLEYISDYSNIWSKSFKIKNKFTSNLAFRLYNELRNFDRLTPLAIEGLILEIIAETDRHLMRLSENRKPKWLGEVNDLLHSDFLEDLSLSVIAQTINIHPVHLARTFRKHYRSTIGEYLRNLRLEYACREISRSEDSLSDIALRAGFTDQSHFSRIFKRRMGVTPTEYRKNL